MSKIILYAYVILSIIFILFLFFFNDEVKIDGDFLLRHQNIEIFIFDNSIFIKGTHNIDSGVISITLKTLDNFEKVIENFSKSTINAGLKYNLGICSIKKNMNKGILVASFSNDSLTVMLKQKQKKYYELKIRKTYAVTSDIIGGN